MSLFVETFWTSLIFIASSVRLDFKKILEGHVESRIPFKKCGQFFEDFFSSSIVFTTWTYRNIVNLREIFVIFDLKQHLQDCVQPDVPHKVVIVNSNCPSTVILSIWKLSRALSD